MGSGKGSIYVVDMRVPNKSMSLSALDVALGAPPAVYGSVVASFEEHNSWVVNVGIQRAWSGYKVYSASMKGQLKFWYVISHTVLLCTEANGVLRTGTFVNQHH